MQDPRLDILKKIMEEMRAKDSGRLMTPKPAAAMEIDIAKPMSEKPTDEDEDQKTTIVRDGALASEDGDKGDEEEAMDPDALSDEDAGILEKLLAGKEEDEPSEDDEQQQNALQHMMSR